MVRILPENHGVVASISNILSAPSSIDEDILELHEEITVHIDLVEEHAEVLRGKLNTVENHWERKIDRLDDVESIHDFDQSVREWLELKNVLRNWTVLREGIPDWDEDYYDENQVELARREEDLFDVSERLESYKAGLEDLKEGLEAIHERFGWLRRAIHSKGELHLAVEGARETLNQQINKMVELEKAANTIESETLEASKELATKVINRHEVLENPSFCNAQRFRYYVLDEDDDFDLLSYWIFHDEIARMELKPRDKTRYSVHTDGTLPVPHVNLYVQDSRKEYLIHVIPSSEQRSWEDFSGA